MAHFHKFHMLPVERRISGESIPVVVPSITIGLWGYLDFQSRELDVVADNPAVTASRKGTVGNSRAWEISSNASVRTRVNARTRSGDIWDWVELTFTPRLDTAKAAESRSRAATNQGALQGAPAGMAAATWTYLLNFTKAHEGCTDFLYNDRGDQPTSGVGLLLNTKELLDKYRTYFRSPTDAVPSLDDLLDDFDAVKPLPRATTLLWHYAEVTGYRIDYADVAKLLASTMVEQGEDSAKHVLGIREFPSGSPGGDLESLLRRNQSRGPGGRPRRHREAGLGHRLPHLPGSGLGPEKEPIPLDPVCERREGRAA